MPNLQFCRTHEGRDHGTIDWSTLRIDSCLYGLSGSDRGFVRPRSGQRQVAVLQPAGEQGEPRHSDDGVNRLAPQFIAGLLTFDGNEPLAGWTITGDVTIDVAKGRQGKGRSLRIGPGGKALLKLRDRDESGKVEFWLYDDGTTPEDAKAHRVGPRWGLVQSDGKLLAVGILYASYLGGNEGYTATACDGQDWFNQLFWLGVNRTPAGWHKWTFDFDPEAGLQVLHNDREVNAVDSGKTGLKGFSAFAVWGDAGQGQESDNLAGRPVRHPGRPGDHSRPSSRPIRTTRRRSLRTRPSGGRWSFIPGTTRPRHPSSKTCRCGKAFRNTASPGRFEQPARVGQFVNGDWYVVGPVTIKTIDPRPLYGNEIPKRELDRMDKERPEAQRVRNGFMLNPPAQMKVAYDSGVRNWFDPSLIQKLPVTMKPGDSLVSTISMPKGLVLHAQLRNKIERGVDDSSPIRTAAVLTCVGEPQPPDAFRPAFCDRQQKIYLARNLKRELLPTAAADQEHPQGRAVHPLHAAALGGNVLLRLRGARGEHAAVRAGVRPRGRHLRLAAVHGPQAGAERAAAGELRPGGHRPGRHGPRGPSRLDGLGRARQRAQAPHRLRRDFSWAMTNWPTSTGPSPR